MIVRIFAWMAVIFGAAISFESTFVAHRPNVVWIAVFLVGVGYFAKNGFIKKSRETEPAPEQLKREE